MYKIGDMVMYKKVGVCKIEDIRPEKFNKEPKLYYVLKPEWEEGSTIYCPADAAEAKMRGLLSQQEVFSLIRIMPETQTEWIENSQIRQDRFLDILKNGDHQELVKLIKTLYVHQLQREKDGKRLYLADKKIMQEAETLLYGEFAHVLKIRQDEVVPFIMGELRIAQEESYGSERSAGVDRENAVYPDHTGVK